MQRCDSQHETPSQNVFGAQQFGSYWHECWHEWIPVYSPRCLVEFRGLLWKIKERCNQQRVSSCPCGCRVNQGASHSAPDAADKEILSIDEEYLKLCIHLATWEEPTDEEMMKNATEVAVSDERVEEEDAVSTRCPSRTKSAEALNVPLRFWSRSEDGNWVMKKLHKVRRHCEMLTLNNNKKQTCITHCFKWNWLPSCLLIFAKLQVPHVACIMLT